jgi:hypothetical protein
MIYLAANYSHVLMEVGIFHTAFDGAVHNNGVRIQNKDIASLAYPDTLVVRCGVPSIFAILDDFDVGKLDKDHLRRAVVACVVDHDNLE